MNPLVIDVTRPVALIAGQGLYPQLTAAAIRRAGIPLRLIAFEEETPRELIASFGESERRLLKVGHNSAAEFAPLPAISPGHVAQIMRLAAEPARK